MPKFISFMTLNHGSDLSINDIVWSDSVTIKNWQPACCKGLRTQRKVKILKIQNQILFFLINLLET